MRVVIQTVYENVDAEWARWYAERQHGWPEDIVNDFLNGEEIGWASKDPTSEVRARTTVELSKPAPTEERET